MKKYDNKKRTEHCKEKFKYETECKVILLPGDLSISVTIILNYVLY